MVFVLLAWPRSGTNMLCKALNTHGKVRALFEIFHPGMASTEGNFFGYMKSKGVSVDAYASRNLEIMKDYIQQLEQTYADKFVIMDVKYWSTHLLNGEFFPPSNRPVFFSAMLPRMDGVVHLVRSNPLRVQVSLMLGTSRGVFHSAEELEARSIEVHPGALIRGVQTLIRDRDLVTQWLGSVGRPILTVDYDRLVSGENGALSGAVMEEIANFLGVTPAFDLKPKLAKTTPQDLRAVISNFDQVCAALVEAGYEEMLQ